MDRRSDRRLVAAAALLAVSILAPVRGGPSDEPVLVVSLKSIDELLADARRICGTGQGPSPLDLAIQGTTGGRGFLGVDTSKPLGLCVSLGKDAQPLCCAVIPMKEPAAFVQFLGVPPAPQGGLENRIFMTQPFGRQVYVKVASGHCFLSNEREPLESPPRASCLAPGKFDLCVKYSLAGLSTSDRKVLSRRLTDLLRLADSFSGRIPGPQPFNEALELARELRSSQLEKLVQEGERALLGLNFDAASGVICADWEVVARSGSSLAAEYNALGTRRSLFSKVYSDSAAFSCICTVPMPEYMRGFAGLAFRPGLEKAHAEVDQSKVFASQADKENAHESLHSLADSFDGLNELDIAAVLDTTSNGKAQAIVAFKVADGRKFLSAFERWSKFPAGAFQPGDLKLDVARVGDGRIHRLALPDNKEGPFAGSALHVGIRGNAIVFTLGGDGLAAARSALERTGTSPERTPPVAMHVRPSKLFQILPGKDPNAERIRKAFSGSGDYINLEVLPARDGVRGRLTLGEAFLRLIQEVAADRQAPRRSKGSGRSR